jgi:hypothetical protein
MNNPITIVIVRALGLSGATWFNLVIGSHEDAMSMGPPARILDLPERECETACFVHRERCDLWPAFLRERNHCGRFFADLAAFTGKSVFVVNYPSSELVAREIDGQGFRVLHIRLVRDGRATLYSHLRHYGSLKPGTTVHHIVDWQVPAWDRVDRKMRVPPETSLVVRYEDMVRESSRELGRIGEFVGLEYDEDAVQFWRQPQHLTAGNTGVIDLLCRLQGETGHYNRRADTYAKIAEELSHNPEGRYLDESWVDGLSHEDKVTFDCLLGERNALYDYARDPVSEIEREAFLSEFDRRLAGARAIEQAAKESSVTDTSSIDQNWWTRLRRFARGG